MSQTNQTDMTSTVTMLKTMREVGMHLDGLYTKIQELGTLAATSLGGGKRAQITGLESIANSALKVGDVRDYIKIRTARQREWLTHGLGKELLAFIENDLERKRTETCKTLGLNQPMQQQQVYLLFIRELVRQLAAQYEYALKMNKADA